MSNKSHDVTPQAVVEFARNLYILLAKKFGGATTLNELRVMNQIILCHFKGRNCSVTALHKVTGISMPTVSRAVTNLRINGWLSEHRDSDDGRKQIISLDPRAMEQVTVDTNEMIQWINDYR